MKNSKLIDICQAIDPSEWKKLLDFAASPYFNKQKEVLLLCEYLFSVWKKGFPEEKLSEKIVWKAVFPNSPYAKKKLAYLMSDLLKLIELFLGQLQFEDQPDQRELFQLEAFAKRSLHKSYKAKIQKLKKRLVHSQREDGLHYQALIHLSEVENHHFSLQNLRVFNPHLKEQNHFLDQYFVTEKLRLFCNMLNQKRTLNSTYDLSWPLIDQIEEAPGGQKKLINTYFQLYKLLLEDTVTIEDFAAFRAILPTVKESVSKLELISLYYTAINFCLVEINKGNREYAQQLLFIYEEGLKTGTLLINGVLSPWMYKNIVKLGLGLRRFDWIEKFIYDNTDRLPPSDRNDAFHFNLSDLYYHQEKHDLALEYLNKVEFSDVSYKHGAKIMLLKIFFEKEEVEAFHSLASSYQLLLLREKLLSDDIRAAYKTFLRLANKLFKANSNDEDYLKRLSAEIEKTKRVNDKRWLISQVKKKLR